MALKAMTRFILDDGRKVFIDTSHLIGIRGTNEGQTQSELIFDGGQSYTIAMSPQELYDFLRLVMTTTEEEAETELNRGH